MFFTPDAYPSQHAGVDGCAGVGSAWQGVEVFSLTAVDESPKIVGVSSSLELFLVTFLERVGP